MRSSNSPVIPWNVQTASSGLFAGELQLPADIHFQARLCELRCDPRPENLSVVCGDGFSADSRWLQLYTEHRSRLHKFSRSGRKDDFEQDVPQNRG